MAPLAMKAHAFSVCFNGTLAGLMISPPTYTFHGAFILPPLLEFFVCHSIETRNWDKFFNSVFAVIFKGQREVSLLLINHAKSNPLYPRCLATERKAFHLAKRLI